MRFESVSKRLLGATPAALCRGIATASLLALSIPAHAITCTDIMAMVNVNVPVNIVAQTMEASGSRFTADDIRCLAEQSAPPELVDIARKLAMEAEADVVAPVRLPEPEPEEDAVPRFDDTDSLGSNIPADGDEVIEGDQSGPDEVENLVRLYRAKKVLTASKGFFDLLEDGRYADYESKIQYYLAKSLLDLEMYHGAQHYFMEVVRQGPRNPYFKYALPKLVAIAELTGNDAELLRIVHKIPPEAFPRQARNHLFYLMGRKLYDESELSSSAKYFQQISAKSDLYLRSKYFEGVIHNERGKLKSAVKAFRDVYQAESMPVHERDLQEFEDLKDLSLVNIARIYYALDRFENADNYYSLVDRGSTYWPESLFERAWTQFWLNDLNGALGLLLTVYSPHFTEAEYIPEATVLRALSFFQFCDYDTTEKMLLDFEEDHGAMRTEIKAFLEQYSTGEGRKLSDQAFDTYFSQNHQSSKLDKNFFLRILRNRDLSAFVRHLDLMDEETRLIDAQKAVWRDSVGSRLKQVIERDRQRYKRQAGLVLLKEMARQYDYLGDLMSQSQIIRFEVVDAQRADYEYRAANQTVQSVAEKKIDFATSKDVIYWPFNGEFWQDELGYYRYAEKDACNY